MNPELEARIVPPTVQAADRPKAFMRAASRVKVKPARSVRAEILDEAKQLTLGDRQNAHGDPLPNHERIAAIWSVILGTQVTAVQAALCMAGMKLARLAHDPGHVDSAIDLAAYAAIAAELQERSQ